MSDRLTLEFLRWMARDGRRLRDPARLVDAVCNQLVEVGVPLKRSSWGLQTSAIEGLGRGIVWIQGKALIDNEFGIDELANERFMASAFRPVMFGGATVRRRLLDPDCDMDFPLLEELRDGGVTDYLVLPIPLLDGRTHAVSWATRDDFGFTSSHIDMLTAVAEQSGLLLELWDRVPRT